MPATSVPTPIPVLVVDDDQHLLRTLADILRLHGYDPVTAADGHAALRVAHERPLALAVVDLRLPDMDGLELIHRLHEVSEQLQVVILTGNATVESAVAALRERSVDYLVKPIAPRELLRTVANAGDRWHRRVAQEELGRALEAVRVSEERYRTIVETAREGVCLLDAAGTITYANERLGRILGREAGPLVGTPFVDVVAVEDRAAATRILEQPNLKGEDQEIRLQCLGGTIWAWISASPLTDESGRRSGALAMITDITERRQLEERVRRVQKLDAVGRLASGIAHDFNNMLTVILAEAEFALEAPGLDAAVAQSLVDIRKAATSAAGLTRQLLTFSRANPVQATLFSLNDLVRDIDAMLRRLIGADVKLVTRPQDGLLPIKADRGQIEQVVTNLVVNARDAMPGGGQITLATSNLVLDEVAARAQPGLAPGRYAVLTVSDTGTGMSDETKSHLFEPFFTTKAVGKGTGLGLATSYGIVKRSGGHIGVYSEVGRGATFHVFLPAAAQPADKAADEAVARDLPRGDELVLLVEDRAEVRAVGARMLRAGGYQVLEAGDADEALQVLEAGGGAVKVLLTDLVLPGTGGELLAATVRRLVPGIKVIYASGYPEHSALAHNGQPADAFIQKPLTAAQLLPLMRRVLDGMPG